MILASSVCGGSKNDVDLVASECFDVEDESSRVEQ
jgi:hypothetical protein